MSESTDQRVKAILVEHLGVEADKVTPDIRLCPDPGALKRFYDSGGGLHDLGADSLDVVELVMTFEEEFRIEITDDEGEKMNSGTVRDCYDLIAAKTA